MLRFAANLSLLFSERPLLERFGAARDAGFEAVEIQFPYDHDAASLARAARDANVQVVLINAPVPADASFGIACLPERTAEFRASLDGVRHYAQALGTGLVNVLAGQVHGRSRSTCRATLIDNLVHAAQRLEGIAHVLLEPINAHDVPDYFVSSVAAARQVVADCSGHVGLQFDVYHAARMGLDPLIELTASLEFARHVQFADAPGRHEPGTGQIDFEPLWHRLNDADYAGFVSAEYRPSADTLSSLGWLDAWNRFTARR